MRVMSGEGSLWVRYVPCPPCPILFSVVVPEFPHHTLYKAETEVARGMRVT
jgi:hypothetical protein